MQEPQLFVPVHNTEPFHFPFTHPNPSTFSVDREIYESRTVGARMVCPLSFSKPSPPYIHVSEIDSVDIVGGVERIIMCCGCGHNLHN